MDAPQGSIKQANGNSRRLLAIAAFAVSTPWAATQAEPIPVAPRVDLSIAPDIDASTGQTSYSVKSMDFDLLVSANPTIPIGRCEARRHEDVKAFEDYRTAVERLTRGWA